MPSSETALRAEESSERRRGEHSLVAALAWCALGALPAALVWTSDVDPLVFLVWLGIWSAPIGAGSARLAGVAAASIPLAWCALLWISAAGALPAPHWAALVVLGLYAAGWGIGQFGSHAHAGCPLACLVVTLGLFLAPRGFGVSDGAVLPAATRARLLDASPVAWVVESAGVDWMRQPATYERAGSSGIGPDLRTAYRGSLAAPLVLLVGCVVALAGRRLRARRPQVAEE